MYYVWCMMCGDWALYYELFMYLCYFDTFIISFSLSSSQNEERKGQACLLFPDRAIWWGVLRGRFIWDGGSTVVRSGIYP
jgi:hypothetical protein